MAIAKYGLYYGAAAATAIAGMLHLMLGPGISGFNPNQGILFIVGGIAQVFWIIPMIRRWGRAWYSVGIGGTMVFMALFLITRVAGNPINGRGGGANPTSIAVEVFQAAFIALAAAVLIYESRKKKQEKIAADAPNNSRSSHAMILAGIVVALVLIGSFALPALTSSQMGGPPRQGGGAPSGSGQFGGAPQGQASIQNSTATS